MLSFRKYIALPLVLAGAMFLHQCGPERSGKKLEKEQQNQQNMAERILTARTMGLAFLEENKLEEAEAEFLKLTSMAPEEAIGYANLGLVYLRMGKYDEAESNLVKALEITPRDANIRLNLATVYKYQNRDDQFISELEKAIEADPGHVQSIYRLAEYYGGSTDKADLERREKLLSRAVEVSPGNIVPRLHLIEVLLHLAKPGEALIQLEEVSKIFPEFPEEARAYYDQAFEAIKARRMEDALTAVMIFHNYLKLSGPYNKGITELKGFEGTSVGRPMFTFSDAAPLFISEGESILDAIRFTDVTESAGLSPFGGSGAGSMDPARGSATHIAIGDFDHDGSDDLYLGTYKENGDGYHHYMLKSEMGRFTDATAGFGLKAHGEESFADFTDFNNDGWFDLLLIARGEPFLYKSVSEGKYEDVTGTAFREKVDNATRAIYFDMDHEGDLDLFLSTSGNDKLFRNNGDGTFSDYSESSGLSGPGNGSREACFGDYDDDGDMDLLVLNQESACELYMNMREGRFMNMTSGSGLQELSGITMIASGDYNNDGFLDLFVAGPQRSSFGWFRNTGKGTFLKDKQSAQGTGTPGTLAALDAEFLDFDNDGYLDLFITGEPLQSDVRGGILLHNDGTGAFEDVSHLLPDDLAGGRQVALADYNEDGDLDLFIAGLHGGVRLVRNDGGNANHHLKVRLIGIRSGSGKNNHYGIGAKIELRAGNLYQMKVVTQPNIYFGLGDRSDVDVVRILWTNGTPQNIFAPGIEQDLIEEQQLKGSCPFLYAWNGEEYIFIKDIMWRSALGMPMGIMGEGQTYAFADASRDYYKIPGRLLKPRNGRLSIQVTGELWETIYFDEVELLAVDHPDTVEVYVDEQFVPPPYPPLEIHHVSHRTGPRRALDQYGNDVTSLLLAKDDRYVAGFKKERYQGITEMSELVIDPGQLPQTDHLFLFLNGWIFPTDASINLALSQGENEKVVAPYLQVINGSGAWETVIFNLGFPQGKDKTVIADLSGKFLSADHRVRICTNMEIYWDQAFFAQSLPVTAEKITRLSPVRADHHYRGFSAMQRKGGPYGPHWFDYQSVTTGQKWRDLEGSYTRYGDVLELLLEPDNKYIIANAGDETTIEFDASLLQELPRGWSRDYLIYSTGWVKDGDMNTAEGNRVGPLPFHGMTAYPYPDGQSYPDSPELRKYHKKYNTREVSDREFSRAVFELR